MAIDLHPSRDLTLIFERDDVKEAFAGHCWGHESGSQGLASCRACHQLVLTLAEAILEWQTICDQSAAVRAGGVPDAEIVKKA